MKQPSKDPAWKSTRGAQSYLTRCIIQMVLESQLTPKIFNVLFTIIISKQYVDGFVGELTFENHSFHTFCEIESDTPSRVESQIFPGCSVSRRFALEALRTSNPGRGKPVCVVRGTAPPPPSPRYKPSDPLCADIPR